MPDVETTGDALRRLYTRAGLSVREFAMKAGYRHGSGVQRYIDSSFEKRLPVEVAERMADALAGLGSPPIERNEVLTLAGILTQTNALPFEIGNGDTRVMPRDVPIYGTALGADEVVDGEAIEQTTLNTAEVIGHLKRPQSLHGRADVYGLYVQGSSMAPRFRDGDSVYVEQKRQPRIGEDVVVYLRMPDEHDGERPCGVLIKTLVRKNSAFVELEQYTPHLTFRIPMERVARMDRVIPWSDILS